MIKIRGLNIFSSDQLLLKNLNLDLIPGQFWAILGNNGYGKTTLLHTISGMQVTTKGHIEVGGRELAELNPLQRAQKMALLPQLMEPGLNCTVKQTVSYGRYPWNKHKIKHKQDQQKTDEALREMQIYHLRNNLVQQISGGELRKVELATILAQDSEIMLLDEPLNHLDIQFRYHLMNVLKKLSEKKLIIIVTHDIQYVKEYCSDVLVLKGDGSYLSGKASAVLTPDTLDDLLGTNIDKN